ncbi:MAG: PilN domain-containing protein [Planctomycetes bacterium]|nr:PilN domain-containing protein [Planctomycetota bacterium]
MKRSLNLLPFQNRVRELTQRRVVAWVLVWGACAAAMLGLWWLKQDGLRTARQQREAAQSSYAPLQGILAESEKMQEELAWLEENGIISAELLDEKTVLTLIGQVGKSVSQCDGRLVVRNLLFERRERPVEIEKPKANAKRQQAEPEKPEPRDTGPWAVVTLKGEAVDNVAVATFVVGLRESGLFRRVELSTAHEKRPTRKAFRSYQIDCDI